jgi:hypothetical protein
MYTYNMLEKYIISPEEGVGIALKYSARYEVVGLGGNARNLRLMEHLLATYFNRGNLQCTYPARNKVRFNFRVERKKFADAIDEMKRQGMNVTEIERLERIMR